MKCLGYSTSSSPLNVSCCFNLSIDRCWTAPKPSEENFVLGNVAGVCFFRVILVGGSSEDWPLWVDSLALFDLFAFRDS